MVVPDNEWSTLLKRSWNKRYFPVSSADDQWGQRYIKANLRWTLSRFLLKWGTGWNQGQKKHLTYNVFIVTYIRVVWHRKKERAVQTTILSGNDKSKAVFTSRWYHLRWAAELSCDWPWITACEALLINITARHSHLLAVFVKLQDSLEFGAKN